MNRRTMLALSALSLSAKMSVLPGLSCFAGALENAGMEPAASRRRQPLALPSAEQVRWQDLEIGLFVHFGNETYLDGRSHDVSVAASEVDPVDLDTDQWARTAVALGARYIVFVAKHQYGFCCWQTETTAFSLAGSPWRDGHGDIMRDLSASCVKFKLGLGVYLSPRDDSFGAATGGICKTAAGQSRYDAIYRQQLTELLSRYGPITEIWFDGATATPVGDLIEKYQPGAAVFQGPQATVRWVGNEDGFAPYPCWNGVDRADAMLGTATALDSNPDGEVWLPSEVDVSIRRPDWFWAPDGEKKTLSKEHLLSIYYRSVGRGAQLLLNIPPNPRGLFDEKDVASASAFGEEVRRRFGKPLAATSGTGTRIELVLSHPQTIDTIMLREEIAHGERVRGYTLEGLAGSAWLPLGDGTAIGHKRIQPVDPVLVTAVRLVVTHAVATPLIRSLAVFHTGTAPPSDWAAPTSLWAPGLAGSWHDFRFAVDLHSYVHAAAQYRLRLIPGSGVVTSLKDVILTLNGVPQPKLVKHVPGKPNELILDVTGLGDTGTISGVVEGASSGQILLGRL